MDASFDNANSLMHTGVFKTRTDMVSYLLMRCMKQKGEPLGSWALRAELERLAVRCSTATIGRYLKELDDREYSVQVSNLGRVLTPLGSARLAELEERLARIRVRDELSRAVQVNELDELSDLIWTRKVIEVETARLAATSATPEEVRRLLENVEEHRAYIRDNKDPTEPALQFHFLVGEMAHNRSMAAILQLLLYEERRIESVIVTLVTRERGRAYVEEHAQIAEAIRAGNGGRAAELMAKHMMVLYDAIQEQAGDQHVPKFYSSATNHGNG